MTKEEKKGFVLSPGGRAGKYHLLEKLGQGTFGSVFKARDTELERDVAFKVLNPAHQMNNDVVSRFLQEARATARIKHPGIVIVLDSGRIETEVGELAFLVMELLEGESLMKRITREKRLAPSVAIEICQQIASALDAAHRADVLHRDLKPDNVFLVPDPLVGSGVRVKVFDFGLAKLGRGGHTMMNTILGTPRYMSPEQCRSSASIDARSDVYSLGCIVFELLTGRTPFDGDLKRLVEQHQFATPARVRTIVKEVDPNLDALVERMLSKDPSARPQTMAEVHTALGNAVAPIKFPDEKSDVVTVLRRQKPRASAPPALAIPPTPAPSTLEGVDSLKPQKTTVAFPPPPPEEPRDMTEIVSPLSATQSVAYTGGRWWWLLGAVGVAAVCFVMLAFRSPSVRTQPASAAPRPPVEQQPVATPAPVVPEQRTPRSSEAPAASAAPAQTPAPTPEPAPEPAPAPAAAAPVETAAATPPAKPPEPANIEMSPEQAKPKPRPPVKKKPPAPSKPASKAPQYDPDSLFLKK